MIFKRYFLLMLSTMLILTLANSASAKPPTQSDDTVITPENVMWAVEIARFGNGTVQDVTVSSDNQVMAVTTTNGLWLYDFATGDLLRHIEWQTDYLWQVVFTLDHQYVMANTDTNILIWSVETGELIRQFQAGHTELIRALVMSTDGQALYSAGFDGTVRSWDIGTGAMTLLASIASPASAEETLNFEQLFLINEGTELLAVTFRSGIWRINVATGEYQKLQTEQLQSFIKAVISPDEQYLGIVSFTTIGRWHIETDTYEDVLDDMGGSLTPITWQPNSPLVALGDGNGSVVLLNMETGEITATYEGHEGYVRSITFSDDGNYLISSAQDGLLKVWDRSTSTQIYEIPHFSDTDYVTFSSDSSQVLIASAAGDFRLHDIQSGERLQEFEGHGSQIVGAVFSSDDRSILTLYRDGLLILWSAETGEKLSDYGDVGDEVFAVRLEPDPAIILALENGEIQLKNVETDEVLQTFNSNAEYVSGAHFTPDGTRLLTIGTRNFVLIWDVETGEELYYTQSEGQFFTAAVSPDGALLLTSQWMGTVIIDDTRTSTAKILLSGYIGDVVSAAWSPDGTKFATAAYGGVVRVWGVPPE